MLLLSTCLRLPLGILSGSHLIIFTMLRFLSHRRILLPFCSAVLQSRLTAFFALEVAKTAKIAKRSKVRFIRNAPSMKRGACTAHLCWNFKGRSDKEEGLKIKGVQIKGKEFKIKAEVINIKTEGVRFKTEQDVTTKTEEVGTALRSRTIQKINVEELGSGEKA